MNVDLIVVTFDDESKAAEALKDLQDLQKDGIVKVQDAAVIVKDEKGKVSVQDTQDVDAKHGALFGAVTGGLIGLFGGAPGALVGATVGAGTGGVAAQLIDLGFSKETLRDLQDSMQPGSSALVAEVEPKWIDRVVKELEDLGGQLYQQALKVEQSNS